MLPSRTRNQVSQQLQCLPVISKIKQLSKELGRAGREEEQKARGEVSGTED